MRQKIRFLLFLSVIILSSCDPEMVYDQLNSVGNDIWTWNDPQVFAVEMSDTTNLHNIFLQVRHTVDYPLSNLYIFVNVKGPTGQHLKDTVNLILANPDGSWIGRGVGNLREIELLYRNQTQFRLPGLYTFTLEQGMRKSDLPVTDVGVRIERNNP